MAIIWLNYTIRSTFLLFSAVVFVELNSCGKFTQFTFVQQKNRETHSYKIQEISVNLSSYTSMKLTLISENQ
jgi:hypothetical protein